MQNIHDTNPETPKNNMNKSDQQFSKSKSEK